MNEAEVGICPRCGRELVRGTTPTGKVCFRCPTCGGVAVTLPALRESLDARNIAALTCAARAAEHAGCTCPGCGGRMSLLKVGDGKDKLEIDVCGRCLSVWCDKGEYETLAPPPPKAGAETMRQLLERTSLKTRERYAANLLESQPEYVSPADYDIGDILRDVARLVIGAPTLWRDVKPTTPIFSIALALSLPIVQACAFYGCKGSSASYGIPVAISFSRMRDFWQLSEHMAEKFGFDLSSPLSALFPFVQVSGITAIFFAIFLFMPLAVVERRVGHAKFIKLFLAFMAVSAVAQTVFTVVGLATGRLCGIIPIALGYLAYVSFAWPDLHIRGKIGLMPMSINAGMIGLIVLLVPLTGIMIRDFLSFGLGPITACLALGVFLGRRVAKKHIVLRNKSERMK